MRQDAPTHTVRCSSVTPGHVEIHGSASKISIRARKEPYEIAAAIQMGSVGAGCCCHAIRQVEFLASSWHIMHIAGRLGIHFFFRPTQNKRNSYPLTNEPLQVCLQVCLLDHKQMVTVTFICWIGILLFRFLKHKASVKVFNPILDSVHSASNLLARHGI